MKTIPRLAFEIAILLSALLGTQLPRTEARAEAPEGFTSLFNGQDLTGWKGLVENPKSRAAMSADEANSLLAKRENAAAYENIFNGRDFTGWTGDLENCEVVDGAITCKAGKGGTVFTEKEYSDFIARLEFKLPPGGNNGLAIRYSGEGQPHLEGLELQVLDSEDPKYTQLDPGQYHGSVYGLVPAHRGVDVSIFSIADDTATT